MAKVLNDVILGFWNLIITLLTSVIKIFTTSEGKLNFFGFLLLVLIIITILEVTFNIAVGSTEERNEEE